LAASQEQSIAIKRRKEEGQIRSMPTEATMGRSRREVYEESTDTHRRVRKNSRELEKLC